MQKYNLKSISPTGVHDPREKLVRGTFEVRLVCAVQAHPPAQVNLESTLEMYEIKITSLQLRRRQIVDLLLLKMEIICNIAFPGCLVLQPDNPVVDLGQVEPGGEEGGRGDADLAQPHLQRLWTLHLQV